MRVLIVEDDPATRDLLERALREEAFQVDGIADGVRAEESATSGAYDAIVLDVMLPGLDGFMLCRRLRARGVDTPILLLTGRHGIDDRVRGLDAGADDFLAKPFALQELLARLRALTRRGRTRHLTAVLSYGPIEIEQHHRVVRVNGVPVAMTVTEYRLLEYLVLHAEALVTREELVMHVWGGAARLESNVVDVYIGHLRRKLDPAAGGLVRTVRGAGYTLRRDVVPS
jgi:DNA-binding response OmpR family regulator